MPDKETIKSEFKMLADFIRLRSEFCSEPEIDALDNISSKCIYLLAELYDLSFMAMIEMLSLNTEEVSQLCIGKITQK